MDSESSSPSSSSTNPRKRGLETEIPSPIPQEEPTVDADLNNFILEGFSVLKQPLEIHEDLSNVRLASPRPGSFPRDPAGKYHRFFFSVNHPGIFEHIAECTNVEMDRKVRLELVTGQYAHRYFHEVSSTDIVNVLALQFIFRGRANVTTLKGQFEDLHPRLNSWPMTEHRYKAIMGSLTADFDHLAELLRNSWRSAIDIGTEWCVDETIYSFYSKNDETCPQRFIPRKPHPNGLLTYPAAVKTQKGPYLVDVEIDHRVDALNPRAALQRLAERWSFCWGNLCHVIFDAGFSGELPQLILGDLNLRYTASFNQGHKKWLFDVLKKYCQLNKSLAVIDRNNIVWSVKRSLEGEHFLVTTAFTPQRLKPSALFTEDQVKSLSKIGIRGLSFLANYLGVPFITDEYELAHNMSMKINEIVTNDQEYDVEQLEEAEQDGEEVQEQQQQVSEDISAMSRPELNVLARKLKIKVANKSKTALLQDIMKVKNTNLSKIAQVKNDLVDGNQASDDHHQKYRECFNAIDLHDRLWYSLQNHHKNVNWRSKLVISLLISSVINSHVMYKHYENIGLIQFAEELAIDLLS